MEASLFRLYTNILTSFKFVANKSTECVSKGQKTQIRGLSLNSGTKECLFAARCVSRYSVAPADCSCPVTITNPNAVPPNIPGGSTIRNGTRNCAPQSRVVFVFCFVDFFFFFYKKLQLWLITAAWTHLGCRRPRVHDRKLRSSCVFPAKHSPFSPKMPSAFSNNHPVLERDFAKYPLFTAWTKKFRTGNPKVERNKKKVPSFSFLLAPFFSFRKPLVSFLFLTHFCPGRIYFPVLQQKEKEEK